MNPPTAIQAAVQTKQTKSLVSKQVRNMQILLTGQGEIKNTTARRQLVHWGVTDKYNKTVIWTLSLTLGSY